MFSDLPDIINKAANTDINKGNDKVEEEPDFNHLDVRCDRQALNYRYVHADQHQHDGDVYCNCGLKVEGFEVVGNMTNYVEQDSRYIDCCKETEKTPTKKDCS